MEPLRRQPLVLLILGGVLMAILYSTAMALMGERKPFLLAVPFGASCAVVMGWVFRRRRETIGTYHSELREASMVVGEPADEALQRVVTALRTIGARRIHVDAAARRVRARHRSRGSFGEVITAVARSLPDGSTRLSVRSDGWPYTPLFDWGVNQRNVEAVLDAIRRDG